MSIASRWGSGILTSALCLCWSLPGLGPVSARSQTALEVRPEEAAADGQLPPDALKLVQDFERQETAIRQQAEEQIRPLRKRLVERLRLLQDSYTRAGKLDEALALRSRIRQLSGVRPDPGVLRATTEEIGQSRLYEVTGSSQGSVWGTTVYTSDSHLGTAAVHLGLLKPGQTGLVLVRILPGRSSYSGSLQNGVQSLAYGQWAVSFTIEPYED